MDRDYKLCLIIPIYNHSAEFLPMVENLAKLKLNCLLVDDGSDQQNASTIDVIARKNPWIQLIRLQNNSGKGVAVCEGLKQAWTLGFSHALQLDADGQHNLEDIPEFIKKSKANPKAIVTGNRIYINAPNNRIWARKLTDFWVYVNTLSKDINDSLCGFRLYPLASTCKLIHSGNISKRMDFDSDIIVKLHWQGIEVQEVRTKVRYHPDITSHFDLLHDNIAISKMHTRLFFGMLIRIPYILRRKLNHAD